jgi:hypothetical protein
MKGKHQKIAFYIKSMFSIRGIFRNNLQELSGFLERFIAFDKILKNKCFYIC